MKRNIKSEQIAEYTLSLIVASILTLSVIPVLLLLTAFNTTWVLFALPLWIIGDLLIFYPFILHVYPHLMSKISLYLLSAILIIVSSWLNITFINFLLPNDYIYYTLFNATLVQIFLFGLSYVAIVTKVIMHFTFTPNFKFYKEESLF